MQDKSVDITNITPVETPQTDTQHSPQKSLMIPILATILICAFVFGATGYYLAQLQSQKANLPTELSQVIATPTPTVTSTAPEQSTPELTTTVPSIPTKKCSNVAVGITLSIPETWLCDSKILGEIGSYDGSITITSDVFEITASTLGRGSYCGDAEPANESDVCRTSTFYTNDRVSLDMFTSEGQDKEIFGSIKTNTGEFSSWISIKYKNMETTKLTPANRAELIKVLDSLQVSK